MIQETPCDLVAFIGEFMSGVWWLGYAQRRYTVDDDCMIQAQQKVQSRWEAEDVVIAVRVLVVQAITSFAEVATECQLVSEHAAVLPRVRQGQGTKRLPLAQ
jgi:hypothetical protein